MRSLQNTIKITNEVAIAKQNELRGTLCHHEKEIDDLRASLKERDQNILKLENDLQTEQKNHVEIQNKMKWEFEQYKNEAQCHMDEDKAKNDALTSRVEFLTTMTSSYIQNLYEQCLALEKIISLEDEELLKVHSTHMFHKSSTKTKPIVKLVMEHLVNRMESIYIDWEGILTNDDDRRVIFGNLNNRSQINNGQIDDLIKRIHVRKKSELERIHSSHVEAMTSLKLNYENELTSLRQQIEDDKRELKDKETTLLKRQENLSNALTKIEDVTGVNEKYAQRITKLETDVSEFRTRFNESQDQLLTVRNN